MDKDTLHKLEAMWQTSTGLEIAAAIGISQTQVFYYAGKLGLKKNKPVLKLTHEQEQLVYGSMLGDGNVKRNGSTGAYFRAGNTDIEYVQWKLDIMAEHVSKGGIYIAKARGVNQNDQYWFSTKTYDGLTAYNEVADTELLSKIDAIGLTVWMLDDGWASMHSKSGNMCISCQRFTEEVRAHAVNILNNFGLQARSVGVKHKNISISSNSNSRIKELVYSVIPSDVDIVSRKIGRLS